MENKTLDNVVNYEHKEKSLFDRIKNGVCYVTASAVLASGAFGCAPKIETAVPPVRSAPVMSPYLLGSADIDESKFSSLDPVSKIYLWEGKKVLFSQEDALKYANRQKLEEIQAYIDSKKPKEEKPADKEKKKSAAVAEGKTWLQRNKKWVIPAAVVVAAGAGYLTYKKIHDDDDHNKKPAKKGSNPNVGPDQGPGDDHDKDSINW